MLEIVKIEESDAHEIEESDALEKVTKKLARRTAAILRKLEKRIPDFEKLEIVFKPYDKDNPLDLGAALGWRWTDGKNLEGDYYNLGRHDVGIEQAADVLKVLFTQAMACVSEVKKNKRG